MEKIIEVISNEAKKLDARRKISAHQEKRHESNENLNLIIENIK